MHATHDDPNGIDETAALEATEEQLDTLRELGVSELELVGLSVEAADTWINALRAEHGTLERLDRET